MLQHDLYWVFFIFLISFLTISNGESDCVGGIEREIDDRVWCIKTLHVEDSGRKMWCNGELCGRTLFCYESKIRPWAGFKRLWNDVTIHVNASGEIDIIGASTDTQFADLINSLDVQNRTVYNEISWIQKFLFSYETLKPFAGNLNMCVGVHECTVVFSYFGHSCVRPLIQSTDDYLEIEILFNVDRDNWVYYSTLFCFGYLLVRSSAKISDMILVYYMSGVILGVLLFVIYASNFLMKKSSLSSSTGFRAAIVMQATFVGVSSYFFDFLVGVWYQYRHAVAIILIIVSLMSFAITHWWLQGPDGPSVSQGLKDIVRWVLRVVGFVTMSFGTRSLWWSIFLGVVPIIATVLLPTIFHILFVMESSMFPSRGIARMTVRYLARPFLTMEEYEEEGRIYTESQTKKLFASEKYQKWALNNLHRIQVTPRRHDSSGLEDPELSEA